MFFQMLWSIDIQLNCDRSHLEHFPKGILAFHSKPNQPNHISKVLEFTCQWSNPSGVKKKAQTWRREPESRMEWDQVEQKGHRYPPTPVHVLWPVECLLMGKAFGPICRCSEPNLPSLRMGWVSVYLCTSLADPVSLDRQETSIHPCSIIQVINH